MICEWLIQLHRKLCCCFAQLLLNMQIVPGKYTNFSIKCNDTKVVMWDRVSLRVFQHNIVTSELKGECVSWSALGSQCFNITL